MIDFAKLTQQTRKSHSRNNGRNLIVEEVSTRGHKDDRSDPIDNARQLIAAKPAICFAIAFAFGGALGWLTSKK